MHSLILFAGLLAFFLLLSAFFSGSETAFMAVNRLRLRHRAESGDRKAQLIRRLADNPDRLLAVILLGNTIANIAAASILTYVVTSHAPRDRADTLSMLATAALTLVVLIFCELTPKILAAANAEAATERLIHPVRAVLWLLTPVARLGELAASVLLKILGVSASASPFAYALSEEEVRALIAATTASDLTEDKRAMLGSVFEIGATQVREVMIPRTDVTAADINAPLPEILALIKKTNYSRIPIYRESFDNILGILNVKDLLQHLNRPAEINLRALLRPAFFIPDTARLQAILRQLQSTHQHMAVVVDEFGGVEGIVTLEDLLEEIVGEIRDEHDVEPESIRKLGPNLHAAAANLSVKAFNRAFQTRIPESREYTTIAGFLQSLTGRLLREGENVRFHDVTFTIEKSEGFKLLSVRVKGPALKQAAPPALQQQ